ncbi:MAG: glucokinase [Phycisphaerales bacterium]
MPEEPAVTETNPPLPKIIETPVADGLAVGVDLGGTNIQFGVIEPDGRVVARAKLKTGAEDGVEKIVGRIAQGIEQACAEARVAVNEIAAVGIGAPGPVNPHTGEVLEAVNLRWGPTPLCDMVSKLIGREVFLDNDVNAAVYGEARLGAARGVTDLVGCWVGTGVGGGLILGGRIYYGKHYTAGELGHMILWPGNAPGTRSVEHNCSRNTIANRVIQLVRSGRKSSLDSLAGAKAPKIKSKVLAEAYRTGDELVCEVINDSADRLGIGLANLVTLLSLEMVVLGGGLVEALGEPYLKRVRQAVLREVFPAAAREELAVVQSTLGDDAGITGAGLIALHRRGV